MKRFTKSKFIRDEEGQILPWMAPLMIVFLGFAGLTIDLGRGWMAYRELQASADAAALAGAKALASPSATVSSVASAVCNLSANSSTGTNNCTVITTGTPATTTITTQSGVNPAHGLASVSTTATLSCLTGVYYITTTCGASNTGFNVLHVSENGTIPTYFIQALRVFGIKTANSLTMNSTSAATLNATTPPLNVAIVIDTTQSMNDTDPGCGKPAITCALNGVQQLLENLPACAQINPATGACTAHNNVSLFTFPPVQANTVNVDTTCTSSGKPTVLPYIAPTAPTSSTSTYTQPTGTAATYQITNFGYDYAGSSSGTLSTSSSSIVNATGGTTGTPCTGLQAPGGDGTYFAGAINQAQTALMAESSGTTSQPIMIILSDGAANSTKFQSPKTSGYGSEISECQQAITAANNATSYGTIVYTIAYGASTSTSDCTTDSGAVSPCTTLKDMSSGYTAVAPNTNTSHFYSDDSTGGDCPTPAGGPSDLPTIFKNIATNVGIGRLIPNS